jgi:PAS domain S-box-containing protein
MIGMHITKILGIERYKTNFKPALEKLVKEGQITLETNYVTKDSRILQGERKNIAIYDRDNQYNGSRVIFRDLTERKRAEEALRESEEKYRDLYEKAPNAYFTINIIDGSISRFNNSAICLFDYDEETITQMKAIDLYADTPQGLPKRDGIIKQLKAGESIREVELQMKHRDGHSIWVSLSVEPIIDNNESVTEVRSIVTDISKLKLAEEELIKKEKELEDKNENLEEMNAALKVLLKKSDEDKIEIEEKVVLNVRELVEPYLKKLNKSGLNARQKTYASIVESNLMEIISPFATKLSSKFINLSPTEIKVANLVKQGKTTKEIAELSNCSPETTSHHRKSIRKKLKLLDKKSNLRTHLLTLS